MEAYYTKFQLKVKTIDKLNDFVIMKMILMAKACFCDERTQLGSEIMFYESLDAVEWTSIDFVSISIKFMQFVSFELLMRVTHCVGVIGRIALKCNGWTLLLPMQER